MRSERRLALHIFGWYIVLILLGVFEGLLLFHFLFPSAALGMIVLAPLQFLLWSSVIDLTLTKEERIFLKRIDENG
jgi:hypothetical protein